MPPPVSTSCMDTRGLTHKRLEGYPEARLARMLQAVSIQTEKINLNQHNST